MIRFGAPLLLIPAALAVALIAWRLRGLPRGHAGLRRRLIQGAMLLAAICAALALGRLSWGTRLDRMAVVFVLDQSRSVAHEGRDGTQSAVRQAQHISEEMPADDLAGLVVFGSEAATAVVPSPRPRLGGVQAVVPREGSDLAAGLRRALADLPDGYSGRLVLVSDGVETQGDSLRAASVAASRGVRIDVLPVERAPRPEIAIERVRLPQVVDPEEPVELRVVTRATRATRARLRVQRDGRVIAEGETELREGHDLLTLRDIAPEAGVHRYDVVLEPLEEGADASAENNEGGAFVRVSGGSQALVLSDRPAEARALAAALTGAGLRVTVGGRERVPVDLGTLATYDLLVLSDLNARAFTEDQLRAVASYVRDLGGGLLMVGVRDAFGLGGYAYTPIEGVLPATFDLRRRRERASLSMVIAIDNSGSMGMEVGPGTTKLDLANEAAARSATLLSPFDRVGVAHVDTEVHWTLPMTSVGDPRQVSAAIRAAQPGGGGILVDLTLRASYGVLREQPTQLKHLLLFSDGNDSEEMSDARSLVEGAARAGITSSVVSMGNGPDTPELEALSHIGGGRFYIVEDLSELPRIFTQETIAASRSAISEEAFRPSPVAPSEITEGLDFEAAPALSGYVVVNARPEAEVLLAAREEDPLLLRWQQGVGRAAVFATDTGAGLGRPWLSWGGYRPLFGQLGRSLARAAERRGAEVRLDLRGGVGRVRVEALDESGRYQNHLHLRATVARPSGEPLTVLLTQTGAGRYEGRFDAAPAGPYLVTVAEEEGSLIGSAGVVRPRGDELRGEGTDRAKLAQLASLTGGRVRADLEGLFEDRPPPTYAFAPLWPSLVIASLLLLLFSVALRRLVWSPARLLARLRRREGEPAGEASEASAAGGSAPPPEVAAEIASAQAAEPASAASAASATSKEGEAAATGGAPEAPKTLAQALLAKRKKRK